MEVLFLQIFCAHSFALSTIPLMLLNTENPSPFSSLLLQSLLCSQMQTQALCTSGTVGMYLWTSDDQAAVKGLLFMPYKKL